MSQEETELSPTVWKLTVIGLVILALAIAGFSAWSIISALREPETPAQPAIISQTGPGSQTVAPSPGADTPAGQAIGQPPQPSEPHDFSKDFEKILEKEKVPPDTSLPL